MTETLRTVLHAAFLDRYAALKRRLTGVLGSEDAASDALHETWLRVERLEQSQTLSNPGGYLFRMALHMAADQRRRDTRLSGEADPAELDRLIDELADPQHIASLRQELDVLAQAMEELPPRRRAILGAARGQGMLNREIALMFGISERMVERELRAALAHCGAKVGRQPVRRHGPPGGES